MIDYTILTWLLLGLLFFAVLGLAWLTDILSRKLKYFRKPRLPITTKGLESISKQLEKFSLEQRLWLLQSLLGSCEVTLHCNQNHISIINATDSPGEDDNHKLYGYVG